MALTGVKSAEEQAEWQTSFAELGWDVNSIRLDLPAEDSLLAYHPGSRSGQSDSNRYRLHRRCNGKKYGEPIDAEKSSTMKVAVLAALPTEEPGIQQSCVRRSCPSFPRGIFRVERKRLGG